MADAKVEIPSEIVRMLLIELRATVANNLAALMEFTAELPNFSTEESKHLIAAAQHISKVTFGLPTCSHGAIAQEKAKDG